MALEAYMLDKQHIFMEPMRPTDIQEEHDDDGQRWGFSEGCDIFLEPGSNPKLLHDFASRLGLIVTWFRSKPFPHYRLTRQRRLNAIRIGAIVLDDIETVVFRQEWQEFVQNSSSVKKK